VGQDAGLGRHAESLDHVLQDALDAGGSDNITIIIGRTQRKP
jgi:serine/threonine protein phosphatase PrpC